MRDKKKKETNHCDLEQENAEHSKQKIHRLGRGRKFISGQIGCRVLEHNEKSDTKSKKPSQNEEIPTIANHVRCKDNDRNRKEIQYRNEEEKDKKEESSTTSKMQTRQTVARSRAVKCEQPPVTGDKTAKILKMTRKIDQSKENEPKYDRTFFQFTCNICRMILSTKFNLKRHLETHYPIVKRLKCKKCKKTCSNKFNYELHYQRCHGQEKPPKPTKVSTTSKDLNAKSKSYPCDKCDTVASTKFNLQRHKTVHKTNVKRLKCVICGITCANKYNYQQHCLRCHDQSSPRKPKSVLEPSKFPFRINANISEK